MADALCGPSNPLHSFRKHTQVDRTLQQDRLVGPRHSPAQGFRTPDPRSATADAEFRAFENAPPNSFQFHQREVFNAPPAVFAPPPQSSQGWAADFQKLQISGPQAVRQIPTHYSPSHFIAQPLPVDQFRTEAPLVRSTNAGWHLDFMQQRSNTATPVFEGKQAVRDPHVTGLPNHMPYVNGLTQQSFGPDHSLYQDLFAPQQTYYGGQLHSLNGTKLNANTDESFESHFAALENQSTLETSNMLHEDGVYINERIQDGPSETQRNDIRIGSDAIHYVEQKDRTQEQSNRDADELARTAGHLLNLVQHDTSAKFQNSQFLGLMRKLRDREVRVQGNELQSTTGEQVNTNQDFITHHHSSPEPQQSQLQPHDPNTFQFPDMNAVYDDGHARTRYPGSWDYPPTSAADRGWKTTVAEAEPANRSAEVDHAYNIDNDQYPRTQIQDLHPGGRLYPEQSPRLKEPLMMSGARDIAADDFDGIEENFSFASRYQKPSVSDDNGSSAST